VRDVGDGSGLGGGAVVEEGPTVGVDVGVGATVGVAVAGVGVAVAVGLGSGVGVGAAPDAQPISSESAAVPIRSLRSARCASMTDPPY
jgi:hypothetical protein